jgi:hypothetical protein
MTAVWIRGNVGKFVSFVALCVDYGTNPASGRVAAKFDCGMVVMRRSDPQVPQVETLRRLIINPFSLCLYGCLMIRRSVALPKSKEFNY